MSDKYQADSLGSGMNGSSNGDGNYPSYRKYGEETPLRGQTEGKSDDEIDLKQLLGTLIRHKWPVMAITLLGVIIAAVYAFSLLPVFESEGTMMISDDRNRYSNSGADLSSLLTTTYGIGAGSRLINEIQVFESRRLSNAVADKILEIRRLDDGKQFPILWAVYPEDSTIVSRDTLSARIRDNMQVNRVDREADVLKVSYTSFSPLEAAWLVNNTIDTYLELSADQNRMAATSAISFLEGELQEAKERLDHSEGLLRDYMDQTSLVQVDGQTSAVITRLADLESQRQQLQVRQVAVNSSIDAYEGQLDEIRPGLAEQFSENVGSTMERSQFRLAELETERRLLLQRNPQLRENPESEPYLVDLDDQIEILKSEINQIAANLISDESEVYLSFLNREGDRGITSQIADLRSRLIELRIEQSQLDAQTDVLDRRMSEENEFFDGLPSNMLELARLQRDAKVNEEIYLTISNQYSETQLWEQTQFGVGRPLDYGDAPQTPSAPRKKLFVLVGFLIGGIAGVGYAFTRETMNRTIDGTEKIRQSGFPMLAVIPDFNRQVKNRFNGESAVNIEGRNISVTWSTVIDTVSPVAESYRRLHNNIIYSNPDEEYQTIVVTSSTKGEGKSTVSINLAATLAEAGKKVVLVDTDLRRPTLHHLTGESRTPGIVEILYDSKPATVAIKPSVLEGLYVITAGRKIPNPSAIMQSQKLRKFILALKERYDHIIIDTPPYGIITDAAPLAQIADGVVLVSRFGLTQTNELNHTVENLKRIRARVIGTVLTQYNHRQSADYYYASEYTYDSYQAYEEYQEEI